MLGMNPLVYWQHETFTLLNVGMWVKLGQISDEFTFNEPYVTEKLQEFACKLKAAAESIGDVLCTHHLRFKIYDHTSD